MTRHAPGCLYASEFLPGDMLTWFGSTPFAWVEARGKRRCFGVVPGAPGPKLDPRAPWMIELDATRPELLGVLRAGVTHFPWKYQRWSVVDIESTGVDVETAKVCEIAVVTMRFGAVVEAWSTLVDPGCPIPAEASAIHGITDAMVAGKPTMQALAAEIAARIDDTEVSVGYNIYPYDQPVLDSAGVAMPRPVIDALVLVRSKAVDANGRPARWWKSESQRQETPLERPSDDTGPSVITWRRTGRHSLERSSRELGVSGPELGMQHDLHRAAWDATLTGRVAWILRQWVGADAEVSARKLREEAARQAAEIEAFRLKARARDAERHAEAPSVEAQIDGLTKQLADLLRQQASFKLWEEGRK